MAGVAQADMMYQPQPTGLVLAAAQHVERQQHEAERLRQLEAEHQADAVAVLATNPPPSLVTPRFAAQHAAAGTAQGINSMMG